MSEINVRILKMLNLSTSSNDKEALSAIRHANKLLKKNELSWDEFLQNKKSKKPEQGDFFGNEKKEKQKEERQDNVAIEMAEEILADFDYLDDREAVENFVQGIKDFYNENNFLTPKQIAKMKTTFEKYEFWKKANKK